MTDGPFQAPRFHAWFERLEDRSVLLMRRGDWDRFKVSTLEPALLDVEATPIARLAQQGSLAAAVAQRRSAYEVEVSIFRNDPKDPSPINVDHYRVWERLPVHRDFHSMVNSASTSDNANMRGLLDDHVFMVKEPPGPDHWLSELPVSVRAIVRSSSSG